MGRIRTTFIKRLSQGVLEAYPDRFGANFEENKKALDELGIFDEKGTRNKVAGFIVNLSKKQKV